jgi:hypothetical protein
MCYVVLQTVMHQYMVVCSDADSMGMLLLNTSTVESVGYRVRTHDEADNHQHYPRKT